MKIDFGILKQRLNLGKDEKKNTYVKINARHASLHKIRGYDSLLYGMHLGDLDSAVAVSHTSPLC